MGCGGGGLAAGRRQWRRCAVVCSGPACIMGCALCLACLLLHILGRLQLLPARGAFRRRSRRGLLLLYCMLFGFLVGPGLRLSPLLRRLLVLARHCLPPCRCRRHLAFLVLLSSDGARFTHMHAVSCSFGAQECQLTGRQRNEKSPSRYRCNALHCGSLDECPHSSGSMEVGCHPTLL